MKLLLIRNATAIVGEKNRFLTTAGRVFFRKTARTILKKGIMPNLILTSPHIRSVQTADILAETISYIGPLIVREELRLDFDVRVLRMLLDEYQGIEELALVGHEPDMSGLTMSFLSLQELFNFEKGAAIHLKIDRKDLQVPATFKWMAVGKKLITSRKEAFAPVSLLRA